MNLMTPGLQRRRSKRKADSISSSQAIKVQKFCDRGSRERSRNSGCSTCWLITLHFRSNPSRLEDLRAKHFDETLKTNLYGYFFMAQAAVKQMKPRSAIINTGEIPPIIGGG